MPRGSHNEAIVDLLPSFSVFNVVPDAPATVVILFVVTFHFRMRDLDISTKNMFSDVSNVRLVGNTLILNGSRASY